jgi:hypothetical protein
MDTPVDATRSNAALWARYIDQQWGGALTPVGGVLTSGLIGIAIANAYAAFWGDFVSRLFASNAAQVTKFAQEHVDDVLPPWPATPLPHPDQATVPPWLRVTLDEIDARERDQRAREASLVVPV